ncbi:MAG: GNAT family N-acetyltransferase [Armatimonadota bacterium]
MSTIHYRPARRDDLDEMTDLFLAAVSDMFRRNNVAVAMPAREGMRQGYAHIIDTGIFYVAESAGRLVGISGGIVRGDIWFLSAFWVLPELRLQGIGRPLLREVWDAGQRAGARTFCVWSSVEITAMALYMRLGMLPGFQLLHFAGACTQLPPQPADCELEPLEPSTAEQLDREMRGAVRPQDHAHWAASGMQGRQVRRQGRVAGYFYQGNGAICPAAWAVAEDGDAVLTCAFRAAAKQSPELRFSIPGSNHAAIRAALDAGLRLLGNSHFFTTVPFGRLEQYLPSGPLLF